MIRCSIRTLQQLDQHPQGHARAKTVAPPTWQTTQYSAVATRATHTKPNHTTQTAQGFNSARALNYTQAQTVQTVLHRVAFLEVGSLKSRITRQKDKKRLSCLKFCLLLPKDLAIGASLALGALHIRSLTSPTGRAQRGPEWSHGTWQLCALVWSKRPGSSINLEAVRTDHSFEPVQVRVANKLQDVTIQLQIKPAGKPPGPWTVEKKNCCQKTESLIMVWSGFLLVFTHIIWIHRLTLILGCSCDFQLKLASCLDRMAHNCSSWDEEWCPIDTACSCCDLQ